MYGAFGRVGTLGSPEGYGGYGAFGGVDWNQIGSKLSEGTSKFSEWWKGLPPETKQQVTNVVTDIATGSGGGGGWTSTQIATARAFSQKIMLQPGALTASGKDLLLKTTQLKQQIAAQKGTPVSGGASGNTITLPVIGEVPWWTPFAVAALGGALAYRRIF